MGRGSKQQKRKKNQGQKQKQAKNGNEVVLRDCDLNQNQTNGETSADASKEVEEDFSNKENHPFVPVTESLVELDNCKNDNEIEETDEMTNKTMTETMEVVEVETVNTSVRNNPETKPKTDLVVQAQAPVPGRGKRHDKVDVIFRFNNSSSSKKVKEKCQYRGKKPLKIQPSSLKTVDISGEVITSRVIEKPNLRILQKGVDLEKELKSYCCFGTKTWNAREYAQGLSTHFSSPRILLDEKNCSEVPDFAGDWSSIKALLKSQCSNDHMSFLLHRVRNTVTVDHFNLSDTMVFSEFQDMPKEFLDFAKDAVLGKFKEQVKTAGKSGQENLNREVFHRLIHSSMKTPMKYDISGITTPIEENKYFLNNVMLRLDKVKFLVGSNIPLYTSHISGSPEAVTIRSCASTGNGKLDPMEAFDLWLDNTLMGCSRTLITHLNEMVVTKTQWVNAKDLYKKGDFDKNLENCDNFLQFLTDSVKTGNSYWLYRAPGSHELALYNVSTLEKESENGTYFPVLQSWPTLESYSVLFALSSLSMYAECLCEAISEKLIYEMAPMPQHKTLYVLSPKKKYCNCSDATAMKLEKLGSRLAMTAKSCKQNIKVQSGAWMIRRLDQITAANLNQVVACLKTVYSNIDCLLTLSAPPAKSAMYKNAVEKYACTCTKLVETFDINLGKSLKFWEYGDKPRKWVLDYSLGIHSILECLVNWHSKVCENEIFEIGSDEQGEWKHLGYRINKMHGDVLAMITNKVKAPNHSNSDSKRSGEEEKMLEEAKLQEVVGAYHRARSFMADLILNNFKVKKIFPQAAAAANLKCEINPNQLLNPIQERIAIAYLDLVKCKLSFAFFYKTAIGTMSRKTEEDKAQALCSTNNPDKETVMKLRQLLKEIFQSLHACNEAISKVTTPENGSEASEAKETEEGNKLIETKLDSVKIIKGIIQRVTSSLEEYQTFLSNTPLLNHYKVFQELEKLIEESKIMHLKGLNFIQSVNESINLRNIQVH